MNPEEAVQAHLDLEASESVAMHFGTFQLTTEGIDEPLRASTRRASAIYSRGSAPGFGNRARRTDDSTEPEGFLNRSQRNQLHFGLVVTRYLIEED